MKQLFQMVPARDGARLATYVRIPGDGSGRHAAVLYRNPYADWPAENEPEEKMMDDDPFAQKDFVVVMQHCRGRAGSEGEFFPFQDERSDGLDCIAWIEKQPWFDGRLYLSGGSYLGYVQLAYLDALPDCVKGACVMVMDCDGSYAFFKNGVYKSDLGPQWYLSVHHPEQLLRGSDSQGISYAEEWFKYPMSEYSRRVYGHDVPQFNYFWNLRSDPYGCPESFSQAADGARKCRVPVLLTAGWMDVFSDGMVEMWNQLPEETRKQSVLQIGPWPHTCTVHDHDRVYPIENGDPGDYESDWLLYLRDGKPVERLVPGKVRYYAVGKNTWEYADHLPDLPCVRPLYFAEGGRLTDEAPDGGSVTYTFDPTDPPSFPGGPCLLCTGPYAFAKQPEPDFRPDVKTFLSDPLDADLTLAGRAEFDLEVSSTADATAFVCRVNCVEADGSATIMQDCPMEIEQMTPGEHVRVRAKTGYFNLTLHKGERLRIDLSSADAHAYRVHTNYAGDQLTMPKCRPADNTVFFGTSRVMLPVR